MFQQDLSDMFQPSLPRDLEANPTCKTPLRSRIVCSFCALYSAWICKSRKDSMSRVAPYLQQLQELAWRFDHYLVKLFPNLKVKSGKHPD